MNGRCAHLRNSWAASGGRAGAGARGFTLVELVIALTLVSLIMLGLLSAMRALGDTGTRLEGRALKADELRLVTAFLRQSLGSASPRADPVSGDGTLSVHFEGAGQTLQWLGVMPPRHGVGGLTHMRLGLIERGQVLALQYQPFDPLQPQPDWSGIEPHWLVEGVEGFALRYQALEGGQWRSEWSDAAYIPGRVQLAIEDGEGAWPLIVVQLQHAMPGVTNP